MPEPTDPRDNKLRYDLVFVTGRVFSAGDNRAELVRALANSRQHVAALMEFHGITEEEIAASKPELLVEKQLEKQS